jgi:hypothetical protein
MVRNLLPYPPPRRLTPRRYSADFSSYLPYIVPHKRDGKRLFCRLTQKKLNKIPREVREELESITTADVHALTLWQVEAHWQSKSVQRLRQLVVDKE